MNAFIQRSLFVFLVVLAVVVIVFLSLHRPLTFLTLIEQAKTFIEPAPVQEEGKKTVATNTFNFPKDGFKLSTLTLNDGQRKALETARINVETFVITQAMITCAVSKLGEARANEIFTGTTPTLIETGTLLPCLKA